MAANRCTGCRRRYEWAGRHSDQPPCPFCGMTPDPEMCRLIDEQMAEIDTLAAVERRQREARRA